MPEGILKPEYLFRPSQLVRRVFRSQAQRPEEVEITTPWGVEMWIRPRDAMGLQIWHLGVLDLPVCEVLWRLLSPGDMAVDVGANIGFFAGLMAARVGPRGRVLAYEPHPEVFKSLDRHAKAWKSRASVMASVDAHECAASDTNGTADLLEPVDYANNQGISTLEPTPGQVTRKLTIQTRRLEADLSRAGPIAVMKVDVEGHEAAVFRGARSVLESGQIRHLVFEEHHSVPSAATEQLQSMGYTLFKIGRRFLGPVLSAPEAPHVLPVWLPPNLLATREPDHVREICSRSGWDSLRGR